MAYLVTGRTGSAHVSSADDAAFNRGISGTKDYLLAGNALTFTASSGSVKFNKKAELVMCGRHCRIEGNESLTITNTNSGMYRRDYVVGRYRLNSDSTEDFSLAVVQGTPASSKDAAKVPTVADSDLYASAGTHEMPLVEVVVNGDRIDSAVAVAKQLQSLDTVTKYMSENSASGTGSFYEAVLAANKTISGGAATVVLSLNLPKGTYVVQGFTAWDKVSNGAVGRSGIMTREEFGNASNHFSERRNLLSSSGGTRMGVSDVMKLTVDTEVCLAVYTSDKAVVIGANVVHTTGLRAVKIA